ncbi:hypothetical protein LLH23_04855 [bacterium]|nr:hypothetical protein [bacterium]
MNPVRSAANPRRQSPAAQLADATSRLALDTWIRSAIGHCLLTAMANQADSPHLPEVLQELGLPIGNRPIAPTTEEGRSTP